MNEHATTTGIIIGWILGILPPLVAGLFALFREAVLNAQKDRIALLQEALRKFNHAVFVFATIGRQQKAHVIDFKTDTKDPALSEELPRYNQLLDAGQESLSDAIGHLLACGYDGTVWDLRTFSESVFDGIGAIADSAPPDTARHMASFTSMLREQRRALTEQIAGHLKEERRLAVAIKRYIEG